MRIPTWLSFFVFVFPLALIPLLFGELVVPGLTKLHVSPGTASLLVFGMLATGFLNISITRISRDRGMAHHPLSIVGLSDFWPRLQRVREDTVIAVNVGGCLIPTGLALYELWYLGALGQQAFVAVSIASVTTMIVCYLMARPVRRVGISIPGLVPPLLAAGLAVLVAPDQAPPVAFVAGVIGPLIGADLLHLSRVKEIEVGIVSIGGAGTFDGIVLSGVVAAYLS